MPFWNRKKNIGLKTFKKMAHAFDDQKARLFVEYVDEIISAESRRIINPEEALYKICGSYGAGISKIESEIPAIEAIMHIACDLEIVRMRDPKKADDKIIEGWSELKGLFEILKTKFKNNHEHTK